jgi:hypothetical protein
MAGPDDIMNCETFEATVLDELYGELTPRESATVQQHAAECQRCGPLLRGLRATRAMATIPMAKPPVDLEQRVLDVALESAPPRRRGRSGLAKLNFLSANPVLALAAGVLLVAGAAGFWLRQDQGPMAAVVSSETVPVTSPAADIPSGASDPVRLAEAEPQGSPLEESYRTPRPSPGQSVRARPSRGAVAEPAMKVEQRDRSFATAPAAAGPTRLAGDEVAAMNASSGLPPRLKVAAAPPAAVDEKSSPLPRSVGRDTNADLRTARQVRDSQGCAAALPLLDKVEEEALGSPDGLAARFDSAKCREAMGDYAGARSRLETLTQVDAYRERARAELSRIATQLGQ